VNLLPELPGPPARKPDECDTELEHAVSLSDKRVGNP
jgi:hypothetical protein